MATISVSPDPVPAGEHALIRVELDPSESQTVTFRQELVDEQGQRWEETRTFTRLGAPPPTFGEASVDHGTLVRADDGADPLVRVYEWSPAA